MRTTASTTTGLLLDDIFLLSSFEEGDGIDEGSEEEGGEGEEGGEEGDEEDEEG